ncbi:hypothetical protein EON65_38460 [archaeon]|nr:MAG: hypothetical protein EON65_38460 [archaeon]
MINASFQNKKRAFAEFLAPSFSRIFSTARVNPFDRTMFGRTARAIPAAKNLFMNASVRKNSGFASTLYNNVWKKSNVMYITYVVAGCVVLEVVYGTVTNYIWDSYNYGVSVECLVFLFLDFSLQPFLCLPVETLPPD